MDRDPGANRAGDQHRRRRRLQRHTGSGRTTCSRGPGRHLGGSHCAAGQQRLQQRQRQQHAEAVAQRLPRPVDRLAGRAAGNAQRRRDLLVAETLQLAHHDRRSLRLG
jgi:hypothetical protein